MISEITSREQLVKHLEGGLAYRALDDFLDEIPFDKTGIRPSGLPYSFYEIFFHIVFAQKDILEYTISGNYKTKNWPEDYWPATMQPENKQVWEDLKADYFEDRKLLKDFILDTNNDLSGTIKNSEDHSLLREVLLVIEHTAYHTGQLVIIQRLLGVYDN